MSISEIWLVQGFDYFNNVLLGILFHGFNFSGLVFPGWIPALPLPAHLLLSEHSSLELGGPDILEWPDHTPAKD